jgi:hypothetical protein
MKLSRLWGAAITWGALLGGTAYSQVPYYTAPNIPYSYTGQVPATAPTYYPPAANQYYPPTAGNPYSLVSAAPVGTQFSGPSNTGVTRLPSGGTTSLVGLPAATNFTGPMPAAPTNSVLANSPSDTATYATGAPVFGSPPVGSAPYGGGVYGGGIYGAAPNGPGVNGYNGQVGSPSAGMGMGYGVQGQGMGYGAYGQGMGNGAYGQGMGSAQGYGCGAGQAGLQPFAGSDSSCGTCQYIGPSRWYVGAYGLMLARDTQEHFTFSFDDANEAVQFTDAKDADVGFGGGYAAVVGHYFNCGCNAVEAVYWGWFPEDASTLTFFNQAAGNLNGIFNWNSLTYNGLTMDNFVNNAGVHGLFRENEAHNFEINVLSFSGDTGAPFRFTGLAGFRYFRFEDQLIFRADASDTAFTGEVDEVFYDIETLNRLIGFQVGGVGTYCIGPRLSLNGGTKLGIFGNHISHTSHIGGPAGTAVINNGPNAGREFYISNSKNEVSFLGEVFVGFGYSITPRWTASAGYRALAITGLALPTDQIYPDLRGINDLETIESQSSLILHGAYFGAQYCF